MHILILFIVFSLFKSEFSHAGAVDDMVIAVKECDTKALKKIIKTEKELPSEVKFSLLLTSLDHYQFCSTSTEMISYLFTLEIDLYKLPSFYLIAVEKVLPYNMMDLFRMKRMQLPHDAMQLALRHHQYKFALLIYKSKAANEVDRYGSTALSYFARPVGVSFNKSEHSARKELLEKLLIDGADPRIPNQIGERKISLFEFALAQGDKKILQRLMTYGSKMLSTEELGRIEDRLCSIHSMRAEQKAEIEAEEYEEVQTDLAKFRVYLNSNVKDVELKALLSDAMNGNSNPLLNRLIQGPVSESFYVELFKAQILFTRFIFARIDAGLELDYIEGRGWRFISWEELAPIFKKNSFLQKTKDREWEFYFDELLNYLISFDSTPTGVENPQKRQKHEFHLDKMWIYHFQLAIQVFLEELGPSSRTLYSPITSQPTISEVISENTRFLMNLFDTAKKFPRRKNTQRPEPWNIKTNDQIGQDSDLKRKMRH